MEYLSVQIDTLLTNYNLKLIEEFEIIEITCKNYIIISFRICYFSNMKKDSNYFQIIFNKPNHTSILKMKSNKQRKRKLPYNNDNIIFIYKCISA